MNYATCSFFDDVRIENTGKAIRIGEYVGDMRVNDLPFTLPSLWIHIKHGTSIESPDRPNTIEIEIPGAEQLVTIDVSKGRPPASKRKKDDSKFIVTVIDIPIRPLKLKEKGDIKVTVISDSGERVRAGRLRVTTMDEEDQDSWSVPLHALTPSLSQFVKILELGNKNDACEFSYKIMTLLAESMSEEFVQGGLAGLEANKNGFALSDTRVWIFFDKPKASIPTVDIKLPPNAPNGMVTGIDRFGFEVTYEEPTKEPMNLEYSVND